jgi:hypothetical protein
MSKGPREEAGMPPSPEALQLRGRFEGFPLMQWTDRYAVLREIEDAAPEPVIREAVALLEAETKTLRDGFASRSVPAAELPTETPAARGRRSDLQRYVWLESASRALRGMLQGSDDVALSVQPNADTLAELRPEEREAVMRAMTDEDLASACRQAKRMQDGAARDHGPANGIRQRFREASLWGKIGLAWDADVPPGQETRRAQELSSRHARLGQVAGFARRELEKRGKPLPPEGEHD